MDAVSIEIPLSIKSHRCLHYSYFIFGPRAVLVVAYLTNYLEPYYLWDFLNVHDKSPEIKFSRASATLPLGTNFKVVFRAYFDFWPRTTSFVLLDNISITEGICKTCSPDEFRCSDKRDECIPLDKVCDLKSDCLKGEDEAHCEKNISKSLCRQDQALTFQNLSRRHEVEQTQYTPAANICIDWEQCHLNSSSTCFLYCPVNCSCIDLSVNCSSANAPVYATSISFYGLLHENLVISESLFPNLKRIIITNSIIDSFNIKFYVYKSYLNNKFDFFVPYYLWKKFTFESHVQTSSLNNTDSKIYEGKGVHIKMVETHGFHQMFEKLSYTVVNFSNCYLTDQPASYYETFTLDLSHNRLTAWHILSLIQILHLQHNLIVSINYTIDLGLSDAQLHYLDLSYNKIERIANNDLAVLNNLMYLKLQHNFISYLHPRAFLKLSELIYLDLSNNQLSDLKRSHFIHLLNLRYLYLQNNKLRVIEGMFDGLMNIQYLQVDSYTLCCAQPKAVSKIQCLAPVNKISSCNDLIDTPLLSIAIWYIALLGVCGNLFGTCHKLLLLNKNSSTSKPFDILSINLGFADFLMGVYLYIIAGANLKFSDRYGFEDFSWRNSPLCTFAGVLATLSSEASALFVLFITIDRILVIRFPFAMLNKKIKIAKTVSVLVWTVSFLLSLLPLFGIEYFDGYYSGSGVCISLPLSVLRKPGWEYSMVLFVGANFVIFIIVLLGQIFILTDVVRFEKKSCQQSFSQKRTEIKLAKSLMAVAVTDVLCWITIGTIGFLTFMGIDVTNKVYAWVIVVVLPINSALNPLIYLLSVILNRGNEQVCSSKTDKQVQSSKYSDCRSSSCKSYLPAGCDFEP
ncbi:G-protein coupled receptor GRL101-like [Saccostrea echinata]|uniref:G-protein coupled receptor GRL101-like n=1 Tax=Saccostrea echinata TaxID=191078 RepID=UPI002A802116|nr:G-protein coupled receptor GRL101-like [Saccostrea echinata]